MPDWLDEQTVLTRMKTANYAYIGLLFEFTISVTIWLVYLYNTWQFTAMKFEQYHQHFTKVG